MVLVGPFLSYYWQANSESVGGEVQPLGLHAGHHGVGGGGVHAHLAVVLDVSRASECCGRGSPSAFLQGVRADAEANSVCGGDGGQHGVFGVL